MDRGNRIILVTGGTGHQGGAVAKHLLEDGWHVRALVRDPSKTQSRALAGGGAVLVTGDLADRASLDAAVTGCYGVYSVQTFAGAGPDGEEAQARNLADAANEAGVQHFVYSSVIGADREAGMPWIVSKHHIESYLRLLDLPLTIWRPVTFMENFLGHRGSILAGRLSGIESPDTSQQFIAVDDIGRFVALSFREPDCWIGQTTEIAGDQLSWSDAASVFTSVLDLPVVYEQAAPRAGMPEPRPDESGQPPRRADIGMLRDLVPGLCTLEEWVHATGWTR
jgi:uncharacterized protein YbjT (DUF2867 family)